MGLGQAIDLCLSKYATFDGRAARAEFWGFIIGTQPACWLIYAAVRAMRGPDTDTFLYLCYLQLLLFAPSLSVLARRLHDVGLRLWFLTLSLAVVYGLPLSAAGVAHLNGAVTAAQAIAAVGQANLIVFVLFWLYVLTRPGMEGVNEFGPDPLAPPQTPRPEVERVFQFESIALRRKLGDVSTDPIRRKAVSSELDFGAISMMRLFLLRKINRVSK